MLDRFKARGKDVVKVDHRFLHETITEIFIGMGVVAEDAEEGTNVLVSTDLSILETP